MVNKIKRFYRSLSTRLQFAAIFLSLVGVTFGIKSYLHVKEVFGEEASEVFINDLWVQIVAAIAINAVIAWLIHITTIKPLNTINEALRSLAENELDIEIPYINRGDQIGSTARKAKVFQKNARELQNLQNNQLQAESHIEQEKAKTMNRLAFSFEDGMSKVVSGVSGAAVELENTAGSLSSTAEVANEEARTLADSSQKALHAVESVSTALEELISSINEISSQVTHSGEIADNAFKKGQDIKHTFEDLATSTREINNVLKLITNVSGQINMLALNATIEASRAGEAGKGFAVVANEVKSLADQTNKAATEIAQQIGSINDKTDNTQTALIEIIDTINQINEITVSISSAMDKQKNTTNDIATSIKVAEETTNEARSSAANVAESSMAVSHASSQVNSVNEHLAEHSKQLKDRMVTFLNSLKEKTVTVKEVPEYYKDYEMVMLTPTDSCAEAIALFSQHNIGVLPVVDDEKLVGVFSERDVIKKLCEGDDSKSTLIADVMTKNPATTLPHEEVLGAILSTIKGGYRHLLVADENRKLLSVLSHRDLSNILWQELNKRNANIDYTLGDMLELKQIDNLKTLSSTDLARDAINLMKSHNFGAVPVVDESKIVGIITERDIIKRVLNENMPLDNPISKVMTPNPDTVNRQTPLKEIIESGVFKKYRHLLIADESGDKTVKSILSLRDFVEIPYNILINDMSGNNQPESKAA